MTLPFLAAVSLLAMPAAKLEAQTVDEKSTLKEAYAEHFLIGATLNSAMLADPQHPALRLVKEQFSSITSANALKWEPLNPEPGVYNFELVDNFVAFGEKHDLTTVGHVLFWHSQTPDWVFEDDQGNPISREALLQRMRERARLLAERYGDKVKIWDVVNESIEDDGSLRQSKFHQIIGPDFNEQAFRIAAEEFPADTVLLYNDYGMTSPGRRDAVVAMARDFQKRGVRIDGIGMQGHWSMDHPSIQEIEESILAFASTGLPIHITELDVDLLGRSGFFGADVDIRRLEANEENNPYPRGNLPEAKQIDLANRYEEIFELLVKHSNKIDRVTFWGVADGDSWLNFWPVRGRTNFPLLFDREYEPKPAFHRVLDVAQER